LTGKGNLEQQWMIEWLMGLSNRLLVELFDEGGMEWVATSPGKVERGLD